MILNKINGNELSDNYSQFEGEKKENYKKEEEEEGEDKKEENENEIENENEQHQEQFNEIVNIAAILAAEDTTNDFYTILEEMVEEE